MLNCTCKICKADAAERVNELPSLGLGLDDIQVWIKEELGFSLSKATLNKHFAAFDVAPSSAALEPVKREPIEIDYKAELENCRLEKWMDNPTSALIIAALQRLHLDIHFLLGISFKREIEEYMRGEREMISPSAMRDIGISFDIVNKVCGIEPTVNQQKAFNTVRAVLDSEQVKAMLPSSLPSDDSDCLGH